MIRRVIAIIRKDLMLEWRGPQALVAMVVFGMAVLLSLGFVMEGYASNTVSAGLLWMVFYFSGVLGLYRLLDMEKKENCMEALRLSPVEPGHIYLAKWIGSTLLVLVGEAILLPLFFVFFDQTLAGSVIKLTGVVVLGTSAFCAAGTLFSSVTSEVRYREVLLPALLLPTVVPVLVAAAICTQEIFAGGSGGAFGWRLLTGANVIYILLSYMLYPAVLEE